MAEGINKSFKKAVVNTLLMFDLTRGDKLHKTKEQIKETLDSVLTSYDLELEYHTKEHLLKDTLFAQIIADVAEELEYDFLVDIVNHGENLYPEFIEAITFSVEEETKQAMESVIHNLNTMASRAGSQVPFSSINFGTDTSDAGRLAIKYTLKAIDEGLGNGETAIFPVAVFRVLDGVNYNPGDPNYDLYKYSMEVSARRLFPNYLFLDATFNKKYLKVGEVATYATAMGCADYDEFIKYIYEGVVKQEPIGKVWQTFSKVMRVKTHGESKYIDTSGKIAVYDTFAGDFIDCKKIICNPAKGKVWYRFTLQNGFKVTVTEDHYFPTREKGRTMASEIDLGDHFRLAVTNEFEPVVHIKSWSSSDNALSYDLETETDHFDLSLINSHNCRTRVLANVNGPAISHGRGNLSFTTVNLPMIALESKGDVDTFMDNLDKVCGIAMSQLYDRYLFQAEKLASAFPTSMGQGIWLDSDKLSPEDKVKEVLKHGTLSMGFVGLAECLIALTGKHHGESFESQQLGLKIIGRMRELCDIEARETSMNYTLLATPAESCAGRLLRATRGKYGIVPGVTDKDYFTNSNHVPVGYKISAYDKIKIEAPYHELTNAGHIMYIEVDSDISKNMEAFETILTWMHDNNIGYGAINHPCDQDPVCGYVGIIDDVCPRCGRREGEGVPVEKLRQIGVLKNSNIKNAIYAGDPNEENDRVVNLFGSKE